MAEGDDDREDGVDRSGDKGGGVVVFVFSVVVSRVTVVVIRHEYAGILWRCGLCAFSYMTRLEATGETSIDLPRWCR